MAHVICIVSQKGGTGKTTSAINIAGSLALFEKRTLLIDCDPLGNATTGLGIEKVGLFRTLFHAITGSCSLREVTVGTELDYLKAVPARFELLEAEKRLGFTPNRETRLRALIESVSGAYDFVILDAPPSLNFLAISAMIAADWLLMPMQCQVFTLEGLGQLLSIAREIQARHNPDLRIAGVLFTMCDSGIDRDAVCTDGVLQKFTDNIFRTAIPWDRGLRESTDFGRPLVLHNITAPGANAYLMLTLELVHFFNNRIAAWECDHFSPAATTGGCSA